jgi:hypothetical protein
MDANNATTPKESRENVKNPVCFISSVGLCSFFIKFAISRLIYLKKIFNGAEGLTLAIMLHAKLKL